MTKHIVALSGGKDSTALALRLAEVAPEDYTYIYTPTGDELPPMVAHLARLEQMIGKPIERVTRDGATLQSLITKQQALPNWRQRWCTRILKIEVYEAWLEKAKSECDQLVSYVGIRADEPERQGGDYSDIAGVEMRFPMRDWGWGLSEVEAYLATKKVCIPERTDCARCYAQRLSEWWELWRQYPEVYANAEAQEAAIGHTFRSPGRDTWPAGLRELRQQFEAGRLPRGMNDEAAPGAHLLPGFHGPRNRCRVCRK